jgi:hypothetical protein
MEPLLRSHVQAAEALQPPLRSFGSCPDPGVPAEQQVPADRILV